MDYKIYRTDNYTLPGNTKASAVVIVNKTKKWLTFEIDSEFQKDDRNEIVYFESDGDTTFAAFCVPPLGTLIFPEKNNSHYSFVIDPDPLPKNVLNLQVKP